MSAPCERIERFADGELAPEEAEAFRQHLLDCDRCKAELGNLLQLKMMASRYAEREPAPALPTPSRWSFSRWSVGAAVGATCAALLAVGVFLQPRGSRTDPWLMSEPERRLEMRLAIAAADQHRPLAARKMGQVSSQSARLPLEALTELERNGDAAGLAAAFLARNDKSLVDQAEAHLAPLPSTPENETLRATALLMKGAPAEALRHLELALDQDAKFSAALWNKALALRDLDLQEAAAVTFREVAALGEPGWAEEARQRAEALSAAEQARTQRWTAIVSAGKELVARGTLPSPDILADRPPILRLYFYDAVRTRTSPEQVRALLPLARELDQQAGGDVLARYIERIAARDFTRRALWAEAYAQLAQGTLPPERIQALIDELLRSTEDDLLMGTLVYARAVGRHLEAFEAKAEASQDPWFRLLASQERAAAQLARGNEEEARQTLMAALSTCDARLEFRCELLRLRLIELQATQLRLDEAWALAELAWRQARATNARDKEELALGHLAQLARLRNDGPLARAYFTQYLARKPGDKENERFTHQSLAHLALSELRFDVARREIDQAMATNLPLTYSGALALADISRQRPAPGDEAAMHRALSEAPAITTTSDRLMLKHALGRFTIEQDRSKGQALLEEVLKELESGGSPEQGENRQKARAYTFTSLILDAGKARDFAAALELFGREQGAALPGRCIVATTADSERSLLIVRGASGQLLGYHEGARSTRLPENLSGFVPNEALAALQGCEKVEVYARPPLLDRPGLLPADLAWGYKLRAQPPPSPRAGRGVHLVVKDVALSPERVQTLGRLNAWKESFGPTEEQRVLMGTEATPSRVLAAMRDATDIDLVTHGVITSSRFSHLVLAREGSSDELSAGAIQTLRLEGAPLVVLAACRAARSAYILHEPSGLPAAFIQAGARAVIAATEEIPDLEAAAFFNAVRERIRQGSPPASALREERQKWLAEDKGRRWLEGVLLYE